MTSQQPLATSPDLDIKDLKVEVDHLENGAVNGDNNQAKAAENADINMGIWEAVRAHKMAVFWSIMVSMCVVSGSWCALLSVHELTCR